MGGTRLPEQSMIWSVAKAEVVCLRTTRRVSPVPEPEHVSSSRIAYDHSADQFIQFVGAELNEKFEADQDRAVLRAFIEQVQAQISLHESSQSPGLVLDVGCGPGRVAAELARAGLDVLGIDISTSMIDAARRAHPDLAFEVGSLTNLHIAEHSIAAAVYWYSIITTPLSELAAVWQELDRVLVEGGQALLAFQTGPDTHDVRLEAYGSQATLTLFHHSVAGVTESLNAAGFTVQEAIQRQAELPHESTPQAFLFIQRASVLAPT